MKKQNKKRAFAWDTQLHRLRRFVGRLAKPARRGFTLAEITTTVAVIGVITAIAVPNFLRIKMGVNMELVRQNLKTVHEAMNEFLNENLAFPDDIFNLGQNDEEMTIAANLTAIDVASDYETEYSIPEPGSFALRTCPRTFGVSGDACFSLSPTGVSRINPWDGAGTAGFFAGGAMTIGPWYTVLMDPSLTDSDRVKFLSAFLEQAAYNGGAKVESNELRGYEILGKTIPQDWRDGFFSQTLALPAELVADFNRIAGDTYSELKNIGIEFRVEQASSLIGTGNAQIDTNVQDTYERQNLTQLVISTQLKDKTTPFTETHPSGGFATNPELIAPLHTRSSYQFASQYMLDHNIWSNEPIAAVKNGATAHEALEEYFGLS